MHALRRSPRLLFGAAALLLLVTGTALAGGPTESDEAGTPPDEVLQRIVDRLADSDIETDVEELAALIPGHGVGGAVRLVTWADATGKDVEELAAMFDDGNGWGKVLKQLMEEDPDLDLSPGIGWVMGKGGQHGPDADSDAASPGHGHGQGHGRANAPGQQH